MTGPLLIRYKTGMLSEYQDRLRKSQGCEFEGPAKSEEVARAISL
jgi:hypothetical protein